MWFHNKIKNCLAFVPHLSIQLVEFECWKNSMCFLKTIPGMAILPSFAHYEIEVPILG
jgi:hypothetical protein